MMLLDTPSGQMLALIWGALIAAAVPLALLSLLPRWRGRRRSLWLKYLAWFVMAPALTIPLLLGRVWMQLTLLLISLYAFQEFARAVGLWQDRRHMWWARALIVVLYIPVVFDRYGIFMAMPAYILLSSFLIPVMRDTYHGMIQRTALMALGVLYFGWFTAHMGFMLNFPGGAAALLVMLMLVVLNDASAYLVGSTLGRHKLSPNLSPNKTIEGMLGAMGLTVAATFALAWALPPMSAPMLALLALLVALGGTLGDLTISLIKRDVGVKDTGNLIPGHGGLLDRLDSVLFVSPVFFHFLRYFTVLDV